MNTVIKMNTIPESQIQIRLSVKHTGLLEFGVLIITPQI